MAWKLNTHLIFVLNVLILGYVVLHSFFFKSLKTYFSQLFLKIHLPEPAQVKIFNVHTVTPKWVISPYSFFPNTTYLMLYNSACKKGTPMVFKWGLFWIQNLFWEIFSCWDISKTVLSKFWKILIYSWFKLMKLLFRYLSNQIYLRGRFVLKRNEWIFSITS